MPEENLEIIYAWLPFKEEICEHRMRPRLGVKFKFWFFISWVTLVKFFESCGLLVKVEPLCHNILGFFGLFCLMWSEKKNIETPLGTKERNVSKEMEVRIAAYRQLLLYSCSLFARIMLTLLGSTSQLGKLRFGKVLISWRHSWHMIELWSSPDNVIQNGPLPDCLCYGVSCSKVWAMPYKTGEIWSLCSTIHVPS